MPTPIAGFGQVAPAPGQVAPVPSSASKRACSPGRSSDETPRADEVVTKSSLADFLASFRSELSADMVSSNRQQEAAISRSTEKLLTTYDSAQQARFSGIELEIMELQKSDRRRDQQHDAIMAELGALRAATATADSAPAAIRNDAPSGIDREADPTIVRINSEQLVSHAKVLELVQKHTAEAGLQDSNWILNGSAGGLSQNFVLLLAGAEGLAARRVKKFLGIFKLPDGSWIQPSVVTPSGNQVRVYFGPDKSGRQISLERAAKKLHRIIVARMPLANVHLIKRDAQITIDWVPLARVHIDDTNIMFLQWQATAVAQFNVPKPDIKADFDAASASSSPVAEGTWCL